MIEWDQTKSPLQLERAFYLVTRTGILRRLRRLRVPAHFVLTQASKLWLHLQPQRWRAENACDRTRWARFNIRITKKETIHSDGFFFGDPYGNRTHITAVKGRCLNLLTNGPGSGNLTRTDDNTGMNRVLYQLSYAAKSPCITRQGKLYSIFCVLSTGFSQKPGEIFIPTPVHPARRRGRGP